MNPCDLSAVEARALIGAKKLSPRELLDSCIKQIEAVDPAVNAMVARDFDRAKKLAAEAEAADDHGAIAAGLPGRAQHAGRETIILHRKAFPALRR